MHFAKNSAAVHGFCIIADLYEQQIIIGVIAVSQGCCQSVLQSSIELWGMHSLNISAAVHWFCIVADLYEQQIIIGVIAESQDCCQSVLQSSIVQ